MSPSSTYNITGTWKTRSLYLVTVTVVRIGCSYAWIRFHIREHTVNYCKVQNRAAFKWKEQGLYVHTSQFKCPSARLHCLSLCLQIIGRNKKPLHIGPDLIRLFFMTTYRENRAVYITQQIIWTSKAEHTRRKSSLFYLERQVLLNSWFRTWSAKWIINRVT